LFPVQNTVPLNGSVEIVATVIEQGVAQPPPTTPEPGTPPSTPGTPTPPAQPTTPTPSQGAGTPVQNGTVVSFTTTIGRIEPAEARTQNGQVRVRFVAGNQSGVATITAFSGGASGRIENLRVGTAAVERVVLSANPQSLGPLGGTSELQARVEDTNGQGVSGVEVSFTSSTGSVSPNPATTDANGIARATLTTTREANVVARVAAAESNEVQVTLNPRTGLRITPPTSTGGAPPAALQPLVFTVTVGDQALVRNVEISWGDGEETTLGAITGETQVAHTFEEAGTYTVTATATDATGFSESVSTVVTVLPAQPPSVTVTASNNQPVVGEVVILTATVSGNTSPIIAYEWNFGANSNVPPITTTSNRATASWGAAGTKVITVRVIQAQGPDSEGFGTVVVGNAN
jgi:hypothetical protein